MKSKKGANNQPKIEIYLLPDRPFSMRVRAIFKSRDHSYIEHDVSQPEVYQEMLNRTSGAETTPQIFINDRYIGDYDDLVAYTKSGELDDMLGDESSFLNKEWDLVVLGAGPAGINAALYGARSGVDLLLLGRDMGGQMLGAGRVENYPGAKSIDGAVLLRAFWEQILNYDIPIRLGEEVVGLEQGTAENLLIHLKENKTVRTKTVIIATGSRYRSLNVQGEQKFAEKGLHYCVSCDGFKYAGKPVAVVGGGNSGMEAALELAKLDCQVKLIDIHDSLKGEKVLIKKVKNNQNIKLYFQSNVEKLLGQDRLTGLKLKDRTTGNIEDLSVSAVFVNIGLIPNTEFLDDLLKLNSRGEIIINEKNETSQERIWAAGDVTDVRDKQIVVAAAEGAKAVLRVRDYLD